MNPGIELDDGLDVAPKDAEIVPLEIDACHSWLLRSRDVRNQTAGHDDRDRQPKSRGSHPDLSFCSRHLRWLNPSASAPSTYDNTLPQPDPHPADDTSLFRK